MTHRTASPEDLGIFCDLRQRAWRDHAFTGGRHTSPDPVIRARHFTNVYRELDPGTVLAGTMLDSYALDRAHRGPSVFTKTELRHQALWLAVAYRLSNRRDVWEAYRSAYGLYPNMCDHGTWEEYVGDLRSRGGRFFTGRHLNVGERHYWQALQDVRHLEPAWVDLAFEEAWGFTAQLREVRGIGRFFAWQVTADLMMSGHLPPDPHHVVLGPGAKLALRWIVDRRPFADMFNAAGRRIVAAGNGHMSDLSARQAILDLRTSQAAWMPSSFVPWKGRPLSLVDLEHALCEYGRWGQLHSRLARSLGEVA
jgi:hypothetical protein